MTTGSTGQSTNSVSTNKNYLVRVSRGGAGDDLAIVANATAKLSLQIENRWVNIMEALGFSADLGPIGAALSTGINITQMVSGVNFLPIWATSHVWRGSQGIEVALDMRFDAWDNAENDVVNPIKKLVKMFSPTRGPGSLPFGLDKLGGKTGIVVIDGVLGSTNNFLTPPGPTPYDYFSAGAPAVSPKTITITIGNALTITNLIPVSLRWDFENRFVKAGSPITAMVSATFMSFTLPTQDEIIDFFNKHDGAS